jgi:predicted transcriptional regulator
MVAGVCLRPLQRQLDHREFMRKTTKQPLALADLEKAWAAFYDSTKVESEKDLFNQGWKTIRTIAEESKLTIAAVSCRVETAIGKGILETKKATIRTNQGVREVNLYRPT